MIASLISPTLPMIFCIAVTDSSVAFLISVIFSSISSVLLPVSVASFLTSSATTANPFPASPARAASIVALRASKFVCSAISRMAETTSPILETCSFRCETVSLVSWALFVASFDFSRVLLICVVISKLLAAISSIAEATELTFALACSEDAATLCVDCAV